jgi:hypothetical protein
MEQDEVALVKAIESGDTDLSIAPFIVFLTASLYCFTTSPEKVAISTVFQSD